MKKVIRLTESELIRLVKRVIKEQTTDPKQLAKNFVDSFGTFSDDEVGAASAISSLKDESEWNIFDAEVKKLSGKTTKQLFNEYMTPYNRKQYDGIVGHVLRITNNKINLGVESGTNKFLRRVGDANLYR